MGALFSIRRSLHDSNYNIYNHCFNIGYGLERQGVEIMWFRKKIPKIKEHQLRWIGLRQYSFHRPMRCMACERTYIMDMFGGWGIEYDFTIDKTSVIERIDYDDIENAINKMMEVGSRNWVQVDQMVCAQRHQSD